MFFVVIVDDRDFVFVVVVVVVIVALIKTFIFIVVFVVFNAHVDQISVYYNDGTDFRLNMIFFFREQSVGTILHSSSMLRKG